MNRLLHALGYSLQANRKTLEGKQHPDRDAQFNHINRRVRGFQRRRQPVVSVDTKKKELVGPFENAGREWRPRGRPEPVQRQEERIADLVATHPEALSPVERDTIVARALPPPVICVVPAPRFERARGAVRPVAGCSRALSVGYSDREHRPFGS